MEGFPNLFGKSVMIALTFVTADGTETQEAYIGESKGFTNDSDQFDEALVMLVQCHDGEVRHFPWEDDILEPAEPGIYELNNDEASIEDPDFTMHWRVSAPQLN